ncbi:hypothetical protein D3C80_1771040 [compost metagenome]
MQRNCRPDLVDILRADAMLLHKLTGRVRPVNFKAFVTTAMFMSQPHVMKHAANIKQFKIDL